MKYGSWIAIEQNKYKDKVLVVQLLYYLDKQQQGNSFSSCACN